MLTAEQIAEQGRRFACCSFDHLIKSMRADIIGETACAEKEWNQSLKAYWAATVMGNTVLTGGCYTMAYATEVASIVGCLCEPVYGCNCPEDSCFISVDEEAIYVPCSTLVNAWVFSGAGDTDLNGVTFIPGPFIPEAEPDTEVFVGGDYTLYELAGAGYHVVDETIGVHLYQGALGGVWTADAGASPAPTQAQGTLGDLCSTDLTPGGRISMAVPEPVNAIYAMDCCGEMELFMYEPSGFDYEFDSGLN